MRAATLGLLLLALGGCATGKFSDAAIQARYEAGRSFCVKERPTNPWCYEVARLARDYDLEHRTTIWRLWSMLFGPVKSGSGTVPVVGVIHLN